MNAGCRAYFSVNREHKVSERVGEDLSIVDNSLLEYRQLLHYTALGAETDIL